MTRASVFNVGEPGRKVREAAAAKEDSFDVNFGSALEDAKRQFIKSRERRRERDPVLKKTHTKKSRKDWDAVKVDEAQINYGLGSKDTTVYDAVAGRVNVKGRIVPQLARPLLPEEVLFRSSKAPIRYEEDDIYFQNEKLAPSQQLPDSDLLKAIHAYTSDYYFCNTIIDRSARITQADFHSMDETALLAMGILMEEAARQRLGTGDLALVEADNEDEADQVRPKVWMGTGLATRVMKERTGQQKGRKRKRDHDDDGKLKARRKRARTEDGVQGSSGERDEDSDDLPLAQIIARRSARGQAEEDHAEEGEEDGNNEDDENDEENENGEEDENDEEDENQEGDENDEEDENQEDDENDVDDEDDEDDD